MDQVLFDYTRQDASGASCTAHAWAKVPAAAEPRAAPRVEGACRRPAARQHGAVLVAHYYVDGDLQDLALETGGCVADSLEMARFGRDHAAKTLVVAGVRFMGESGQDPDARKARADARPRRHLLARPGLPARPSSPPSATPTRTARVVVYANTSAAVKARADWMVTSSCALAIVSHLKDARQEDPVGARPPPRPLHPGADRRRHAAVERRVHRARRVQGHRAANCCASSTRARMVLVHPESPRERGARRPTWSARRRSCSTRC